jgi:squalene synthase HpnC
MERAGGESFPVAMHVLSRSDRRHLLAVYGFARLADELGDELGEDRLAALDWLEQELDRAYGGNARHPLLASLQSTFAQCELPREPFARLIEANRLDQRVHSYKTWTQLQAYCRLSANPVGELVLRVFGCATPERIAQSDDVCTALQLAEHLRDVGEDLLRGRIYLPEEDLVCFGSSHEQLAGLFSGASGEGMDLDGVLAGAPTHSQDAGSSRERLCAAIRFQSTRARELLDVGVTLVRSVPGRPKLAVAGFVAGGRAALDQIERADFEVLGGVASASRRRRMRALVRVLTEAARES